MSGSFRRLDYRLRINKHIERRLVFDVLQAAAARIGLRNHRYVGLGALWFGDFRMAHRRLHIDEMLSFELPAHAARSKFNSPYRSIEVVGESTHDALPKLPDPWWERAAIWWLDYDGALTADVVKDIDQVLGRGSRDSVLVLTVNAERQTYRGGGADEFTREATSVGALEEMLGSACIAHEFNVEPNEHGAYIDIEKAKFPSLLADALINYMRHKVVASARLAAPGDPMEFVPLYRVCHADNAAMVTVGGALTSEAGAKAWKDCIDEHPLISEGSGPVFTQLDLVPFTVKEMLALDRCLPREAEERDFFRRARRGGVSLGDEDLRNYQKYYRHFPLFTEATL
jgi:hypothetical protein